MALIAASLLTIGCGEQTAVQPQSDSAPANASPIATSVSIDSQPGTTARSSTTVWSPPSISYPTIPYTLPPDYGAGPTDTRDVNAVPRDTFAPDAVLPPTEWTLDDTLTVQFVPPPNFRQDPRPSPAIQQYDRDNGLYVLERWAVTGESTFATLSVQTNPGNDSPLLSRQEFSDSIPTDAVTWYLYNGATPAKSEEPPNRALAVLGDWLLMISGTSDSMQAIVDGLTIDS